MLLGDLKLISPHAECIDLHQYLRQLLTGKGGYNVRFGSKADICIAKGDVRFAPNSDRKRGHAQMVMSALPPRADMCSARAYVCFGPKADIVRLIRSPH